MPLKPSTPKIDEHKSVRLSFFICGSLFMAVSVWAVVDEVWTRRPWKKHQENFFKIEEKLAKEERARFKDKLDKNPRYKQISDEIKKLEQTLKEPKTKARHDQLKNRFQELGYEVYDLEQEVTFAKADREESYYEYKH